MGNVETLDIETRLVGVAQNYRLPEPPEGEALKTAVRASLNIWELGPDHIVIPHHSFAYRAAVQTCDFSGHLAGGTGCFKTEFAALLQQHFGLGWHSRNLVGWSSTENYLENLAFIAKDALLVIDDFVLQSERDRQKINAKADRVFRGQANNTGRGRLRSDGTARPPKPPRGAILSTGEDVPDGHSLRARLWITDIKKGDIDTDGLTTCQKDAAAGLYAQAMAGYIQYLSGRYGEVVQQLAADAAAYRDEFLGNAAHNRTAGIMAHLLVGAELFLKFAVECGCITQEEGVLLQARAKNAIIRGSALQARYQAENEPAVRFLGLLSSAIASGEAHVASPTGGEPENPSAWGWREREIGASGFERQVWEPKGARIGWTDDTGLYLEPDAAYRCAVRMVGDAGLGVGAVTLGKRLNERGFLKAHDGSRDTLKVRKTLEGRVHSVLHLDASALSCGENPTNPPSGTKSGEGDPNSVPGAVVGSDSKTRQADSKTRQTDGKTRQGETMGGEEPDPFDEEGTVVLPSCRYCGHPGVPGDALYPIGDGHQCREEDACQRRKQAGAHSGAVT